jgi:hypothetical protein
MVAEPATVSLLPTTGLAMKYQIATTILHSATPAARIVKFHNLLLPAAQLL